MGVPKFYRWISERYTKINDIVSDHALIPEFDHLYLDMNGIIHGCTHPPDMDTSTSLSERDMMIGIMNYLDRIISQIVKPKKSLYMAIDGVAPRAKLNQQRSRRFRSAKDQAEMNKEIQKQQQNQNQRGGGGGNNNINAGATAASAAVFDSNCITPGTEFMAKLSDVIRYFIRKKMKEDPIWHNITVIFSGHEIPGEGEHKIMEHIRQMRATVTASGSDSGSNGSGWSSNERHCIYGQDADLIMLGLVTHEPHFTILREVVNFNSFSFQNRDKNTLKAIQKHTKESNFQLLHLSIVREYLSIEFQCGIQNNLIQHTTTNTPPPPQYGKKQQQQQQQQQQQEQQQQQQQQQESKPYYDLERTIDDFVFMTFLIGNDFLPHMPSLDIGDGAFDLLFDIYKKQRILWWKEEEEKKRHRNSSSSSSDDDDDVSSTSNHYLTNAGEIISPIRLESFISAIGSIETELLEQRDKDQKAYVKKKRRWDRRDGKEDVGPTDDELIAIENRKQNDYLSMIEKIMTITQQQQQVSSNRATTTIINNSTTTTTNTTSYSSTNTNNNNTKKSPKKATTDDNVDDDEGGDCSTLHLDHHQKTSQKQQQRQQQELSSTAAAASGASSSSSSSSSPFVDGWTPVTKPGQKDFKGRYYYEKMKLTPIDKDDHWTLRRSYMEGLIWCLAYYYKGCISWGWYYPYHYGPMLSDLINIPRMFNEIQFSMGEPLSPFQQLMACLPPQSGALVPKIYRTLMIESAISPIIQFYPIDFQVDMNGKKNPWEGVNLLPFIDVTLLKNTIEKYCPNEQLTQAERKRNQFGLVYCYKYDITCKDTIYSPTTIKKLNLPDIISSCSIVKTFEEKIYERTAESIIPFQPKLLHGVQIPYPGFPRLSVIPIESCKLEKIGLNCFGTASKYLNTVITLHKMPTLPSIEELAQRILLKSVYINWPQMHEGKVIAITNQEKEIRSSSVMGKTNSNSNKGGKANNSNNTNGKNNNNTKSKKSQQQQQQEYKVKVYNNKEQDQWANESEAMKQIYLVGNGTPGSGGIEIGNINMRMRILPLQGMKTNPKDGSKMKIFGQEEADVPIQLALWNAPAPDPRFMERGPLTIVERFPIDSRVILTKGKYRGCTGTVVGIPTSSTSTKSSTTTTKDKNSNQKKKKKNDNDIAVRVNTIPVEIPFGLVVAKSVNDTYMPSHDAARILKLHSGIFGRIMGRLQFEQDRYDLGLNLKSNFGGGEDGTKGTCVVGYTRRKAEEYNSEGKKGQAGGGGSGKSSTSAWTTGDSVFVVGSKGSTTTLANGPNNDDWAGDNNNSSTRVQWEYTIKAVRAVDAYMKKFPQLFSYLRQYPNEKKYDANKIFGVEYGIAWLRVIRDWLNEHESAKLPRTPITTQSMSTEATMAIQKAADVRSLALKKCGYPKESLIKIPSSALYRQGSTGPTDILLANDLNNDQVPEIGDRIVNLCADGVPFGMRGTVVGIHEASTIGTVEVIMDDEFICGTSLQGSCSNYRGKLCIWAHLLKIEIENSKSVVSKLLPKGNNARTNIDKLLATNIDKQVMKSTTTTTTTTSNNNNNNASSRSHVNENSGANSNTKADGKKAATSMETSKNVVHPSMQTRQEQEPRNQPPRQQHTQQQPQVVVNAKATSKKLEPPETVTQKAATAASTAITQPGDTPTPPAPKPQLILRQIPALETKTSTTKAQSQMASLMTPLTTPTSANASTAMTTTTTKNLAAAPNQEKQQPAAPQPQPTPTQSSDGAFAKSNYPEVSETPHVVTTTAAKTIGTVKTLPLNAANTKSYQQPTTTTTKTSGTNPASAASSMKPYQVPLVTRSSEHSRKSKTPPRPSSRSGSSGRSGRQGAWREARGPDMMGVGFKGYGNGGKSGLGRWKAIIKSRSKKNREAAAARETKAAAANELKAILGVSLSAPAAGTEPSVVEATPTANADADLKTILGLTSAETSSGRSSAVGSEPASDSDGLKMILGLTPGETASGRSSAVGSEPASDSDGLKMILGLTPGETASGRSSAVGSEPASDSDGLKMILGLTPGETSSGRSSAVEAEPASNGDELKMILGLTLGGTSPSPHMVETHSKVGEVGTNTADASAGLKAMLGVHKESNAAHGNGPTPVLPGQGNVPTPVLPKPTSAADKLRQLMAARQPTPQQAVLGSGTVPMMIGPQSGGGIPHAFGPSQQQPRPTRSAFNFTYVEEGKQQQQQQQPTTSSMSMTTGVHGAVHNNSHHGLTNAMMQQQQQYRQQSSMPPLGSYYGGQTHFVPAGHDHRDGAVADKASGGSQVRSG